jgi:type VI secretion system Hcp family effector
MLSGMFQMIPIQSRKRALFAGRAVLLFLLLGFFVVPAHAAFNSYAQLTLNGSSLDGDTTIHSIGGIDVSSGHIECYAVNHEIYAGSSGRATHTPFKIIKRVDKASPNLYQALAQNQVVAGTIKHFRTNAEDGSTELYFTIELVGARVSAIRHWSPNTLDPVGAAYPHMEEVSFTYQSIIITEVKAKVTVEIEAVPR